MPSLSLREVADVVGTARSMSEATTTAFPLRNPAELESLVGAMRELVLDGVEFRIVHEGEGMGQLVRIVREVK